MTKASFFRSRILFAWSAGPSSQQLRLIRPLLQFSKQQLQEYCLKEGLPWVEDPTNRDTHYLRNLLRARLASPGLLESQTAASALSARDQNEYVKDSEGSAVDSSLPLDEGMQAPDSPLVHGSQITEFVRADKPGPSASEDLPAQAPAAQANRDGADLAADILGLASICSEAKHRLQQQANALLQDMTVAATHPSPSKAEAVSIRETDGRPIFLESIKRWGQSETRHSCKDMRGFAAAAKQARTPGHIVCLRPLSGRSRSLVSRVLAQLLKVRSSEPLILRTCFEEDGNTNSLPALK